MQRNKLHTLLEDEASKRNTASELTLETPDPIMVAKRYNDEYIALICALFSYGNVKAILAFINSLDFALLDESEETITKTLQTHYYRFQTSTDVTALFIALSRLKNSGSLEDIFMQGYVKNKSLLGGLETLIVAIQNTYPYQSRGYTFLVGNPPTAKSTSTYKRYFMFLRWVVRKDNLDMGLWQKVDRADLLMPLDTHTFKVAHTLGLLKRKTYDLKAVLELTETLKKFDATDPIKYDFALYRLGQEGTFN